MLLTEQLETSKPIEPFVQALDRLRNRKQQEALIKSNVEEVYKELTIAAKTLLEVADCSEFMMANVSETLSISANGATLTIIPVDRIGLDSKMMNARGMFCGLVLFFVHRDGDEQTRLHSALRVYPDGFCSDGNIHWVLSEGADCAIAFMSQIIAEALVNSQFYWAGSEESAEPGWTLPVVANQADVSAFRKCIGFECSLPAAVR